MPLSKETRTIVSTLKRDERYQRLRAAFDASDIYKLDSAQLLSEISGLQKTRKVRRLNPEQGRVLDSIIQASMDDQSKRSRLAGIIFDCNIAVHSLKNSLTALEDYLLTTYSKELRAFRTREERARILRIATRQFLNYISEIELVRENAQLFVADIDKAGFAMKMQAETLRDPGAREIRI